MNKQLLPESDHKQLHDLSIAKVNQARSLPCVFMLVLSPVSLQYAKLRTLDDSWQRTRNSLWWLGSVKLTEQAIEFFERIYASIYSKTYLAQWKLFSLRCSDTNGALEKRSGLTKKCPSSPMGDSREIRHKSLTINNLPRMDSNHDKVIQSL